jgi:hydroxypyruvate isomerase
MVYRDLPFLERMERVAQLGFKAYEFWRWRDKDMEAIARKQSELGLSLATFLVDPSGQLVDPATHAEFLSGLRDSVPLARRLGCETLIVTVGNERLGVARREQHEAIVAGLKLAAPILEDGGIALSVEPLNVLVDHKGYYLTTTAEVLDIISEVGSPAVKMLFDIYHQQISEGNLIDNLTKAMAHVGHIHVADVPGRHEPGSGEINYENVFAQIEKLGYQGYVGLEFRPSADPAVALKHVQSIAP